MTDPRPAPPPSPGPTSVSAIQARVEVGLETERRQRADEDYLRQRQALTLNEVRTQQRWRGRVGFAVFLLATAWLIADVILTVAVGWGTLLGRPFRLEAGVIIAFLTTSTATVIGLFLVFLRWLYPQPLERERERTAPTPEDRLG